MNIITTRLSNLCKVITKGTTPTSIGYSFSESGIVFLRVQNINGGKVNYDQPTLFIDELTHKTLSRSQILAGDILVSIAGTIGRAGIVPDNAPPLNCNQAVAIVRTNENIFRPYLRHWLESNDAQSQMIGATVTGTISNLSLTQIGNLQIPLPPLEEQKRIAEILDRAEELRSKRREAIAQLDTLTQAIFIEMFGDPVTNPKGWERKPIKKIGEVITGNTPSRANPDYYGTAIEWIKSDNINTPYYYLTQAEEGLSEAGKAVARIVAAGAILVTCIAGSPACIGNAAIVNREVAFNQQINALVPQQGNVHFLFAQILTAKRLIQDASTASMKGMVSKSRFEEIRLIFPPLNLQQEFAYRIEAVEKLKATHRTSLSELNALFASLQHRAFRGEL